MLKAYVLLASLIAIPLFAVEFTPLEKLESLSVRDHHRELVKRLILVEWDRLPKSKIDDLFKRYKQRSSEEDFPLGEALVFNRTVTSIF